FQERYNRRPIHQQADRCQFDVYRHPCHQLAHSERSIPPLPLYSHYTINRLLTLSLLTPPYLSYDTIRIHPHHWLSNGHNTSILSLPATPVNANQARPMLGYCTAHTC